MTANKKFGAGPNAFPTAGPPHRIGHARARPADQIAPSWDLMLILTSALVLVSTARVHVFIPGISALRPGLLLLAAAGLVWVFKTKTFQRLGSPVPFGTKLALFILFWAGIGIPFGLWLGNSVDAWINNLLVTVLVFLFVTVSVRNVSDVRRLLMVVAIGGAIFAIAAPIQGRVPIRGFGAGGYDPNDSAMFLVSVLPILIFFTVSARRFPWRALSGMAAFAAIIAVVATQSRGGFLALAAVLIFILLFYRGVRGITKVAAVAAILVGLMATADGEYWDRMESITQMDDGYGGEDSVAGRLQIWERGLGYMAANPLTGVGLYNFPVAEGQSDVIADRIRRGLGTKFSAAHSMWIQIGAELGIPGLLAFIVLFGHVSWRMWLISRRRGRWRAPRETALMGSTILGCLVGVAAAGSFLSNAYWSIVWVPLALGIMLAVRVQEMNSMPPGLRHREIESQPARTATAERPLIARG